MTETENYQCPHQQGIEILKNRIQQQLNILNESDNSKLVPSKLITEITCIYNHILDLSNKQINLNSTTDTTTNIHNDDTIGNDDIRILRLQELNEATTLLETSTSDKKQQIAKMLAENELMKAITDKGPGWTVEQQEEKEQILRDIQHEQQKLSTNEIILKEVRGDVLDLEKSIKEMDLLRESVMNQVKAKEILIESHNNAAMEEQKNKHILETELETLHSQLEQDKEELHDLDLILEKEQLGTQHSEATLLELQKDIQKTMIDINDLCKHIDHLRKEITIQNNKNDEIMKQNREKELMIEQKLRDIDSITKDVQKHNLQRNILSEKMIETENQRAKCEKQRDEINTKLSVLENVEINAVRKNLDLHKRQKENISREMEQIDRNKLISEKGSSVILDLLKSAENSLSTLQSELSSFMSVTKEHETTIENLNLKLEKESNDATMNAQKLTKTLQQIQEEDVKISTLQEKLLSYENVLKEKQNLCETVKNECSTQSKSLSDCKEDTDTVKKELTLLNKQISQIKFEISKIEESLVQEHFNHYDADKERGRLRIDIVQLQSQIEQAHNIIEKNDEILQTLNQDIEQKDKDHNRYNKDYNKIVSDRDMLSVLLVQKNTELEKIYDRLNIQQMELNQGEIDYRESISSIKSLLSSLQTLNNEKQDLIMHSQLHDDIKVQCRALENEIEWERRKNKAMREELGRPLNIHRWRTLEHRDPIVYEMIEKIQKIQRQIIELSDKIALRDELISEKEKLYYELKRVADRQPSMDEMKKELEFYQNDALEKNKQMSEIDFDLDVQRQRVKQLKADILLLGEVDNKTKEAQEHSSLR